MVCTAARECGSAEVAELPHALALDGCEEHVLRLHVAMGYTERVAVREGAQHIADDAQRLGDVGRVRNLVDAIPQVSSCVPCDGQ